MRRPLHHPLRQQIDCPQLIVRAPYIPRTTYKVPILRELIERREGFLWLLFVHIVAGERVGLKVGEDGLETGSHLYLYDLLLAGRIDIGGFVRSGRGSQYGRVTVVARELGEKVQNPALPPPSTFIQP